MKITADDMTTVLKELSALGGQCLPLADLALGATQALDYTADTPVGGAVWLATLTQESAYLRTTVEYGSGQRYAPFIGRTFEQVTWLDNYADFGKWAVAQRLIASPRLFVDKPKLLGEIQFAWLGGVWFFDARDLWRHANTGDLQTVANAVNRGAATSVGYPAGWDARLDCYRAWTSAVASPAILEVTGVLDEPTNKRLQQWVGVGMDGQLGPVTYSAIQKWLGRPVDGTLSDADIEAFQTEIGAYVDGDWGRGTTKDLQQYLNGHR